MKTLEFIKTNGIDALETMLDISIKKFDDLRGVLSPNVKCYFGK